MFYFIITFKYNKYVWLGFNFIIITLILKSCDRAIFFYQTSNLTLYHELFYERFFLKKWSIRKSFIVNHVKWVVSAFTRVIDDYFQINYHQYYSSVHTEHQFNFPFNSFSDLCFWHWTRGGWWVKVAKLGALEFLKKLREEGFKFMERIYFF